MRAAFRAASLHRNLQTGCMTGLLLVRFFARAAFSLVPLTRPLAPHSVHCSRAPLYSLVRLLAHSRKMVVFDVSVSGYLVTLLHRQPWSPSAFDENSPNMIVILHCNAVGVRLLLPHKRGKDAKKKKEDDLAERWKLGIRRLLKKVLHKCEEKRWEKMKMT